MWSDSRAYQKKYPTEMLNEDIEYRSTPWPQVCQGGCTSSKQSSGFSLLHWWVCCFPVHIPINYSLRIFDDLCHSISVFLQWGATALRWTCWGEIGSNHSYKVSGAGKIRHDTFHCCSCSLLLESNYFFHNYVVSVFPRLVFKADCHYITLVFNTHHIYLLYQWLLKQPSKILA